MATHVFNSKADHMIRLPKGEHGEVPMTFLILRDSKVIFDGDAEQLVNSKDEYIREYISLFWEEEKAHAGWVGFAIYSFLLAGFSRFLHGFSPSRHSSFKLLQTIAAGFGEVGNSLDIAHHARTSQLFP